MSRWLESFLFYFVLSGVVSCGSILKDRKPFSSNQPATVDSADAEEEGGESTDGAEPVTEGDDGGETPDDANQASSAEAERMSAEEAERIAAEEEAARIAAEEEAARVAAEEEAARIAAEEEAARIAAEEEAARIAAEEEAARIAAEEALAALAVQGVMVYNNRCATCHPSADLESDTRLIDLDNDVVKDQAMIDAKFDGQDGFHPLVLNLQDGETELIAAAVAYLKLQADKAAAADAQAE